MSMPERCSAESKKALTRSAHLAPGPSNLAVSRNGLKTHTDLLVQSRLSPDMYNLMRDKQQKG